MNHQAPSVADVCALGTVACAWAGLLPPIAALLAIIYHLVLLWPRIVHLWKWIRAR